MSLTSTRRILQYLRRLDDVRLEGEQLCLVILVFISQVILAKVESIHEFLIVHDMSASLSMGDTAIERLLIRGIFPTYNSA